MLTPRKFIGLPALSGSSIVTMTIAKKGATMVVTAATMSTTVTMMIVTTNATIV